MEPLVKHRNALLGLLATFSLPAAAQEAPSSSPAPASAPSSSPALPASAPALPPEAPVAPPQDNKTSLQVSGFVAAQVTFDSNSTEAQNHLISVQGEGDAGRIGFAFDATRLNAVARKGSGDFQFEGRAEADLQSAIFFRMRHAYAAASKNGSTLLVGLTDTLVGNIVGPNIFNNDWFFAQGNAYDRIPQLRVSHDTGTLFAAVAILPNLHGAPDALPHAQARVRVRVGEAGTVGVAGHFGVTNRATNPADATQTVDGVVSYLASVDAGLPLGPVVLSAQAWVGAGAAHGTGGHAIGNPLFVVNADGAPVSVPAVGGFVDLLYKASATVSAGIAGGASVLTDDTPGEVAVPVASNVTAVAYAACSLRPNWTLAMELQAARTERGLDPAALDQRQNLDDLRVLFGQRISF